MGLLLGKTILISGYFGGGNVKTSTIIFIIISSLIEGYRAGVKSNNKTFDIKAFTKAFLIVSIGATIFIYVLVMPLNVIVQKYIPKESMIWGWLWGGMFLIIALYLSIRGFIQLKKK